MTNEGAEASLNQIRVKVKLFSRLDTLVPEYDHSTGVQVTLYEGATVEDLISRLEIRSRKAVVVLVGRTVTKSDHLLLDGDEVSIFRLMGGG